MYDIRIKDENHDRLSAEQVRDWIQQRLIDGNTSMRPHGEEQWRSLSSFPEFEEDLQRPAPIPPIPPTPQEKSKRLAQKSLELGILSIFCGITALPAIIQSIRALILMRKYGGSKGTWGKAIFGLIFSSCIFAGVVFFVVAPFQAANAMAEEINCANNMVQLALAMRIYEDDHSDIFPRANQWCDAIQSTNNVIFHRPATPKKQRCGYAMNRNLDGLKITSDVPLDTVLLFESDAGWNASGGPEIASAHHYGPTLNVAFIDGSVDRIKIEDIGKLRWNPYTNSPAGMTK